MINGINTNGYGASASMQSAASDGSDTVRQIIRNPGESIEKQAGRKSSPAECETCKNRKYQDGSEVMSRNMFPTLIKMQQKITAK